MKVEGARDRAAAKHKFAVTDELDSACDMTDSALGVSGTGVT